MSVKLLQTLCFAFVLSMHTACSLWDFAVTTKSKIIFFDEHWQEITSSAHQFERLSALAFDETEEIVYFSDQLHINGSIFSLRLPITPDPNDRDIIEKVVQRTQNETIAGIAYDPLNRNLFWTDKLNKKIYFLPIDGVGMMTPKVLLDFADEETLPIGIALDVCRRKLYWTNANFKNASVERINLDGSGREVIVHSDLYQPHGIVIDQFTDRLYWVDDQQGIHFAVESANLDGSDRQMIVKGLNNMPISLAVTKAGIFWTDMTFDAVWSYSKFGSAKLNATAEAPTATPPHKVLSFAEQPRGIVARTRFLTNLQNDMHCADVVRKIRSRLLRPKTTRNPADAQIQRLQRDYCVNGGEFNPESGVCICKIGYYGARCEINECHNYCVHGTCSISSLGFLKCNCQRGFQGERCETYKCADYCFNDGRCRIEGNGEPVCECRDNFGGERCEQNSTEICALFCRILKHEPETYVPFGCHDICEELSQQSEDGLEVYAIPQYKHLEVCKNVAWNSTVITVLTCGVVACLALVAVIVHGLRRLYKPARPRIKKTFVVRKQATDTPLTNRPMATEQCEITIENCCNMNICDTPCFDPKLVQQALNRDANIKEDKKLLIHNMEDELY